MCVRSVSTPPPANRYALLGRLERAAAPATSRASPSSRWRSPSGELLIPGTSRPTASAPAERCPYPGSVSVGRTHRLFTVEENPRLCGWGAEIVSIVADEAFYDLDAPVRRLAMPDVPAMPFEIGLERALSISAADIAGAARSLMEE